MLTAACLDAYSRPDFAGTRFDYDCRLYNPVDLTAFYRENCKPMRNATYVPETHSFLQEETGFGFDLEAAQQQVNMAKEGETLVFQLSSQEPTLTLEQLKKDMFTDILGRYDSPHTDNPPRTTNLVLAAQAIDGTILNPGEVFSFNAIVGERTPAKGYQPATIFGSGGASEAATGGGVCQVASAIYMATLLADLEIVERTEHMYVVDYVPWGMDATIYWDTNLDYKFRNSSSHPILIRTSVSDGFVHVDLYGVDERDYTVKMTYEVLSTYPWTDEYIQDDTKPVGYKYVKTTPYTGYHVVTYKTIVDKETGKDRTTSREDDSYYTKRNRVTIIGPEPEPAVPEDPNAPVTPTEPADPTPAGPDAPGGMPTPGEPIVSTPADPDPTAPSDSQLPTVTPDTPYIEDP